MSCARPSRSIIAVDSSEISRRGERASAPANDKRCNCPPDKWWGLADSSPPSPTRPRTPARSTCSRSWASMPHSTSSATVSPSICNSLRWPTRAMPPRRPRPPPPCREPPVGSAPASSSASVDLPDPLGPTIPVSDASSSASVTPVNDGEPAPG